ncbi:MAG: response regulator [Aliishimia sp.]
MAQPALVPSRYAHVKCLLVEDSEFDQRRIRRILEQAGIVHLEIVTSLSEARHHLSRMPVDLILMDNGLPDGTGVDLALELKQWPALAKIPVILISDWPTPFMFDKALVAKVHHVLRKDEFNLARAVDALNLSRGMPAATKQ